MKNFANFGKNHLTKPKKPAKSLTHGKLAPHKPAWTPLLLVFSLILALGACDGGDDGEEQTVPGRLTVTNLPAGWVPTYFRIASDPQTEWKDAGGGFGIVPKDEDSFYLASIGMSANEEGSDKNYLDIVPATFVKEDGQWWPIVDNRDSFTRTGLYSVWLTTRKVNEETTTLKMYGINNVRFTNGYATINYADFSFSLPDTDGLFTLTGAGAYNGKYAFAVGILSDAATVLWGLGGATSATALKAFKIEGGQAAIPIYSYTTATAQFSGYSGSHTPTNFVVYIIDEENWTLGDNYSGLTGIVYAAAFSTAVTFSNGTATKAVSEGSVSTIP
jgi:hypothetical protein